MRLFKDATPKDFAVLAAACVVSIAMVGGAALYVMPSAKVSVEVGGAAAEALQPTAPVAKIMSQSFSNPPSPFAAMPVASAAPMEIEIPAIPNAPVGHGSKASIAIPGVPALPGQVKEISVSGVIIGRNKPSMAFITDGEKQITVTVGSNSPWGLVEDITKKGVTIDDRFIPVNRKARPIE